MALRFGLMVMYRAYLTENMLSVGTQGFGKDISLHNAAYMNLDLKSMLKIFLSLPISRHSTFSSSVVSSHTFIIKNSLHQASPNFIRSTQNGISTQRVATCAHHLHQCLPWNRQAYNRQTPGLTLPNRVCQAYSQSSPHQPCRCSP